MGTKSGSFAQHRVFQILTLRDTFEQQKTKKNNLKFISEYHKLVYLLKYKIMARNTSILIGEYYESFINGQIATGKYNSVSEVIRTALRHFEQEEIQTKSLISELELGEKSEKIRNFNRTENLKRLNENFQK